MAKYAILPPSIKEMEQLATGEEAKVWIKFYAVLFNFDW